MLIRRIITLVLSLVAVIGIAAGTASAASAATRHNNPPPAALLRVHNPPASNIA